MNEYFGGAKKVASRTVMYAKVNEEIIEKLADYAKIYEDDKGNVIDCWQDEGYGQMIHDTIEDIIDYILKK